MCKGFYKSLDKWFSTFLLQKKHWWPTFRLQNGLGGWPFAFRRVNKTFKNVWPIAYSARVSDADDWIANIKTIVSILYTLKSKILFLDFYLGESFQLSRSFLLQWMLLGAFLLQTVRMLLCIDGSLLHPPFCSPPLRAVLGYWST